MRKSIEILKYFVIDELVPEHNLAVLDENQSLLKTGILDSLGILQLVAFIETRFELQVEDEDLLPENFETLSSIAEMISKKKEVSS